MLRSLWPLSSLFRDVPYVEFPPSLEIVYRKKGTERAPTRTWHEWELFLFLR